MKPLPFLACALGLVAAPAYAEIPVGVATALTGSMAAFGEQMRNGVEAAAEAINDRGGVLGERIDLILADDACDPRQGVSAANSLVNQGVGFVIGHLCSGPTVPASSIYEEEGIVMITPTATAPAVTEQGLENVFRVTGRDDEQSAVAAEFIAQRYPDAKIAVVHDKQVYGRGLAEATATALEEKGKSVALRESINPGESDFSALVTKMKSAGIDLLYYGGYHTEAGQIVRQMRDAGMDAVMVGADGLNSPDFWAITGPAGQDTFFTFAPDPTADPANADVIERLRAANIDPAFFTLYSYAAMQVLAQAIEQAGEADPMAVAETLHEGSFETVIGPVEFDEKGDLARPGYVVYAWQDGEYAPEWTP